MGGVVVDTSAWIDFFGGARCDAVENALAHSAVVVPPLVIAELISGAETADERRRIGELLQDSPVHETPLDHWIAVGDLRRALARKGLAVTVPDAHVAQCALDCHAILLSGDAIFREVARHTALRFESTR